MTRNWRRTGEEIKAWERQGKLKKGSLEELSSAEVVSFRVWKG